MSLAVCGLLLMGRWPGSPLSRTIVQSELLLFGDRTTKVCALSLRWNSAPIVGWQHCLEIGKCVYLGPRKLYSPAAFALWILPRWTAETLFRQTNSQQPKEERRLHLYPPLPLHRH